MSENDTTNAVTVYDESLAVDNAIAQLKTGTTPMYSSIVADSEDAQDAILEAVTMSAPIADNLGKVLKVVDLIVQAVRMPNERKGNIETVPRIVFITDDGNAYHAMSAPLFRDVQNVLAIKGEPKTWKRPYEVVVAQEGSGTSKYFALRRAPKTASK